MNYLENEFNKRFKDQELSNDQFDTEDLWNDIAQDLDKSKAATKASTLNRKNIVYTSLVLLSIVTLIYSYKQYQSSYDSNSIISSEASSITKGKSTETSLISLTANEKDSKLNNQIVENEFEEKEIEQSKAKLDKIAKKIVVDSQVNLKSQSKSTATDAIRENNHGGKADLNKSTLKNEIRSSASKSIINTDTSNEIFNTAFKNEFENQGALQIQTEIAEGGYVNIPEQASNAVKKELINNSHESVLLLETLFGNAVPKSSNQFLMPKANDTLLVELLADTNFTNSFYAKAFGGMNIIDYNFKSNDHSELAKSKNNAETIFPGYSYGIHVGGQRDFWTVSTGIEISSLWSEFNYVSMTPVSVDHPNVRLREYIDAESGEIVKIVIGQGSTEGVLTHTVRDYNNIKRISIPLQLGIQKERGKINYGFDIGAVLNNTYFQSGKSIALNNSIYTFDGNDIYRPFQSIDVSFLVSPNIGFDIFQNIELFLNPQWRWHQSSFHVDSDFKIGINQFNLNMGLKYNYQRK